MHVIPSHMAYYVLEILSAFSDLVDVVVTEHGVKQRVEVIEKVDHLDGITERGDSGETHNVAEVDRHLVEVLGLHRGPGLQGLSHRTEDGGAEMLREPDDQALY